MDVHELSIPDVLLIISDRITDHTWYGKLYSRHGIHFEFVQDNESYSKHIATMHGLHFQSPPADQAKLVRFRQGRVFNGVVDLRKAFNAFEKSLTLELTTERGEQFFAPRGLARGFCTIAHDTVGTHKVDNFYDRSSEARIRWHDPNLAITWPDVAGSGQSSSKDAALPSVFEVASPFYQPAGEVISDIDSAAHFDYRWGRLHRIRSCTNRGSRCRTSSACRR